jgi:glycosyltransferase involved in cell wall biosynthesis
MTAANDAESSLVVVIPGDLDTRTGGYGYDRRIIAGLRQLGWSVEVVQLADSFPFPTAAARAEAARAFASMPDGALALVDGLAYGALPDEAERHAGRLRIAALVHHPLAAESGLDRSAAGRLEHSERRALAAARAVVVTSRATASALGHYGVSPDRIAVVEPGTDPAPLARGSGSGISLLCVATLTVRKGHEILLRSLASLADRPWRLTCAGSGDRDQQTASRVRDLIRSLGLSGRVTLVGDLDAARLAVEYDRADVFVLPTLYEGYGMAVAEALARGLPVVSTATGGIPDLIARADEPPEHCSSSPAGFAVTPGDVAAFTEALARVLDDGALRARLAAGARAVRDRLPTWGRASLSMARVLERCRG